MVALNATLIQPWWIPLITILVAPLSAAIGALAVYYASKRTQEIQIKQSNKNDKIQAYNITIP
jgi:CHASE2 domain-containing sensor protein